MKRQNNIEKLANSLTSEQTGLICAELGVDLPKTIWRKQTILMDLFVSYKIVEGERKKGLEELEGLINDIGGNSNVPL